MAQGEILEEVCKQRLEVIRLIPEVKTSLAREAFEETIFQVATGEYSGPIAITDEEIEGAAIGGIREVITPKGARLLKRMFEAGMIPQKRKSASRDLSDLEGYIESEAALVEQSRALREERQRKREENEASWKALEARAAYLAEHPEEAQPSEITRDLIDRVFLARVGRGNGGTMVLAGMTCHKELDRYVSNSGKTRGTTVRVFWEDAAGKQYGDTWGAPPPNRRSDPDRNWGLGRE